MFWFAEETDILPPIGQYEFVKKGDPAVVGITKLDGITLEDLKKPRRQLPNAEAAAGSPLASSASEAAPGPASPPS